MQRNPRGLSKRVFYRSIDEKAKPIKFPIDSYLLMDHLQPRLEEIVLIKTRYKNAFTAHNFKAFFEEGNQLNLISLSLFLPNLLFLKSDVKQLRQKW